MLNTRRVLATPEEAQSSALSFPLPLFNKQRGAFPGKVFTNSTIVDCLLACYLTIWHGEPCHEVRNPYRKSYTLRIPWEVATLVGVYGSVERERLPRVAMAQRRQDLLRACRDDTGAQLVPLPSRDRAAVVGYPLSQARYWASSAVEASPQTLLVHIAARWHIEVLFGDSKEELGLDQYQLMSATALGRFWTLAMLASVLLEEERDRLQAHWQRAGTIGQTRREIQRRHRRHLLDWLHEPFQSDVEPDSLYELLSD
jgi:hypothetical protein